MFKFIYSCRLAEMGLATQAFHYCEVIAKSVLLQPHKHSPVLISQLAQVRVLRRPAAAADPCARALRGDRVDAGDFFLSSLWNSGILGQEVGF